MAVPKVVALPKVAPAKVKAKPKSVQNKHLYARSSYMFQAAAYLSARAAEVREPGPSSHGFLNRSSELNNKQALTPKPCATLPGRDTSTATLPGSARNLITQMRGVSRKTHTCLSKEIKRSICKRCDTLLVPAQTCKAEVENASKGGKKPWADVYVVTCLVCGTAKRFPTGMDRQKKKAQRAAVVVDHAAEVTMDVIAGK